MTNKYYRTGLSAYKESEALQQLLKAIDSTITDDRFENCTDDVLSDEFTITINGIQTAFYVGVPQIEALYSFIQHIADENSYAVDINKGIVEG